MSTYYCFSCEDCKRSSGRGFKSMEDRTQALLDVLGCIVRVEQADPWYMFEVNCPGEQEGMRTLIEFGKDHYGHNLRVVDEYSRYSEIIDVGDHNHDY